MSYLKTINPEKYMSCRVKIKHFKSLESLSHVSVRDWVVDCDL